MKVEALNMIEWLPIKKEKKRLFVDVVDFPIEKPVVIINECGLLEVGYAKYVKRWLGMVEVLSFLSFHNGSYSACDGTLSRASYYIELPEKTINLRPLSSLKEAFRLGH